MLYFEPLHNILNIHCSHIFSALKLVVWKPSIEKPLSSNPFPTKARNLEIIEDTYGHIAYNILEIRTSFFGMSILLLWEEILLHDCRSYCTSWAMPFQHMGVSYKIVRNGWFTWKINHQSINAWWLGVPPQFQETTIYFLFGLIWHQPAHQAHGPRALVGPVAWGRFAQTECYSLNRSEIAGNI